MVLEAKILNMVVKTKKMRKKKAKTGTRRNSTAKRRTNMGKTKNHPKRKLDREPCISDMESSHVSNTLSIKFVS